MAFKTEPYSGPATPVKYDYQRYPLNMHRGDPPNHQTRPAHSQEEEEAAVAAGWTTEAPKLPEATSEFAAALSTEERVTALEAEVENLKSLVTELQRAVDELRQKRTKFNKPPEDQK